MLLLVLLAIAFRGAGRVRGAPVWSKSAACWQLQVAQTPQKQYNKNQKKKSQKIRRKNHNSEKERRLLAAEVRSLLALAVQKVQILTQLRGVARLRRVGGALSLGSSCGANPQRERGRAGPLPLSRYSVYLLY